MAILTATNRSDSRRWIVVVYKVEESKKDGKRTDGVLGEDSIRGSEGDMEEGFDEEKVMRIFEEIGQSRVARMREVEERGLKRAMKASFNDIR